MHKAPGKSHRKGITLLEIANMFGTEKKALKWIESVRWPDGPHCPHCGSYNVQCGIKNKSQTHRCRDCPNCPQFTVRVGTIMHRSHLSHQEWAIGLYIYMANIKGVSSMRLHRELDISQKSAWFLLHRLRTASETGEELFSGPVEADETYMGGKVKNMSLAKRRERKEAGKGRGPSDKEAVVGVKDRETNKVTARHVQKTDIPHVAGFVAEKTRDGAKVYTDEAKVYNALDPWFDHESVNHSVAEYVRDQAHTNGMESFWSMMKRGHDGIYHKMSPKHLQRYVDEFAKRHNVRNADTIDQMAEVVRGMVGKRLQFSELTADNGLSSGARSAVKSA